MVPLACVGLFRSAGEYNGADLPVVFIYMVCTVSVYSGCAQEYKKYISCFSRVKRHIATKLDTNIQKYENTIEYIYKCCYNVYKKLVKKMGRLIRKFSKA